MDTLSSETFIDHETGEKCTVGLRLRDITEFAMPFIAITENGDRYDVTVSDLLSERFELVENNI